MDDVRGERPSREAGADGRPTPLLPPRPRFTLRQIRTAVALAGVLILVAAGIAVGEWLRCGIDLVPMGGQCVGVTDVSSALPDYLHPVVDLIADENTRIEGLPGDEPGKVATVAYWLSLPTGGAADPRSIGLRHELEGAHVAQLQANDGPATPFIRLVIAVAADRNTEASTVADEVLERSARRSTSWPSPDWERASTAPTGPSGSWPTRRYCHQWAGLTGDDLDERLIRVAPSNYNQAAAAAAFVKKDGKVAALVFEDERVDDRYGANISAVFRRSFIPEGAGLCQARPVWVALFFSAVPPLFGRAR